MSSPSPPQHLGSPRAKLLAPVRDQQRRPAGNASYIPPNSRKRSTISPTEDARLAKRSKSEIDRAVADLFRSRSSVASAASTQPPTSRNIAVSANGPPYARDCSREVSQRPESSQGRSMIARQDIMSQRGRSSYSPAAPSSQLPYPRIFSHSASPESDHGSQCNPISIDSDSDDFESIMTGRITGQKPMGRTVNHLQGQGARNTGGDRKRLSTPDRDADITSRIAAKFAAKHNLDRSQKVLANGAPVRLRSPSPVIKKEDVPSQSPRAYAPAMSRQPSTPNARISESEPSRMQNGPWSNGSAKEKERVDLRDKNVEVNKKVQEANAKTAGRTNALPSRTIEMSLVSTPSQPMPRPLTPSKENKLPSVVDSRSGSTEVKRNSLLDALIPSGASETPRQESDPNIVCKDAESASSSGPTLVPEAVLPSQPSPSTASASAVALTILPGPPHPVKSTLLPTSGPVPESISTPAPIPTVANKEIIHSNSEVTQKPPKDPDPPALGQAVEIVRAYNTPEQVREKRRERESLEALRLRNEKADQEAPLLLQQIKERFKKRDANKIAQAEQAARMRAAAFVEPPVDPVKRPIPTAKSTAGTPLRHDGRPQRTWGIASTPVSYVPISKSAKLAIKPRATGPKKVTFAETQQTTYYDKHSPVHRQKGAEEREKVHRQEEESDISDEDEDEDGISQKTKPISPQKLMAASQSRHGTMVVRSPQGKPVTNGHISSGGSNTLALSPVRRAPIIYPISAATEDQSPQYTNGGEMFYEYRVIRTSWRDESDPPLTFHRGTYFDRKSANTAARKELFPSDTFGAANYDEYHMEKDANGMDIYSAETSESHIIVYTEMVLRKAQQGPKPDARAAWLNRKVYVVFEKCVIFKKRAKDDEDDLFAEQSEEEDDEGQSEIQTERKTMLGIHSNRDLANRVAAEHMLVRLKQNPDGSKNKLITDADQILFDEAEGNSRKELQVLEKEKTCYEGSSCFYGLDDEITIWVEEQDLQGPLN